jgi:hypothetical protein
MSFPEEINIVADGQSKATSRWEDKPVFQGLLLSYLQNIQVVENLYRQLLDERDIYSAIGAQLDVLGALVGELRLGKEDEPYRQAIFSRIAINTADGTPEKALEILQVISSSNLVNVWEHYAAAVYYYTGGVVTNASGQTMDNSSPAGVVARLLFDENGDSLVPSDLIGDTPNLFDDAANQIIDDNSNDIVASSLIDNSVPGDRSFLPEIEDTDLINPLADLLTKDPLSVISGLIIDDAGDNIVDDSGNFIQYITTEIT